MNTLNFIGKRMYAAAMMRLLAIIAVLSGTVFFSESKGGFTMNTLNIFGKRMYAAAVLRLLAIIAVVSGAVFFASPCSAANDSLSFDGTDDYVNCGDSPFQIANGTWEAWFKPTVLGGVKAIITKDVDNYNDDGYLGIHGSNKIWFFIDKSDNSYYELFSDSTVSTGTWYHVAVTWGSGMKMYVNGVLQADTDANTSGIISSGNNLFIGSRDSSADHFNGQIDEVRVWNVARTQAEISQYKGVTLTGIESGLVAYYQFDEGSGTIASDLAGGDNHG
ncbi:MAG: hypothetical protein BWK80_63375, partial [Desulfobacteraceae bacterium IS3]